MPKLIGPVALPMIDNAKHLLEIYSPADQRSSVLTFNQLCIPSSRSCLSRKRLQSQAYLCQILGAPLRMAVSCRRWDNERKSWISLLPAFRIPGLSLLYPFTSLARGRPRASANRWPPTSRLSMTWHTLAHIELELRKLAAEAVRRVSFRPILASAVWNCKVRSGEDWAGRRTYKVLVGLMHDVGSANIVHGDGWEVLHEHGCNLRRPLIETRYVTN